MKNNRLLALGLLTFLVIAWYQIMLVPAQTSGEVETYKSEAKEYRQKGSPELAIRLFKQALEIKDTLEDRMELYTCYKEALSEQSIEIDNSDMQKFLSETMNLYADDGSVYEMAMEFWKEQGNWTKCVSVMKTAAGHSAVSDRLQSEYDEIKYIYQVDSSRYEEIDPVSEDTIFVKNGDDWVLLDNNMKPLFESSFDRKADCNGDLVAVQNGDTVKLLSKNGIVSEAILLEGETLAGAAGNNCIPVLKNGRYSYVDVSGEKEFPEYDFAGVYCNGRAAVQQNGQWQVIDTEGETVVSGLSEIALDEVGRCAAAERILAREGSGYVLYDIQGEKLAELDAEKVKAFGQDDLAAACKNGLWGFIDTEGNWVISPAYEDAESFSNGFAAVCADGLWGFIDKENVQAIECVFEDVTSFTSAGKCMVMNDGYWRILAFQCR